MYLNGGGLVEHLVLAPEYKHVAWNHLNRFPTPHQLVGSAAMWVSLTEIPERAVACSYTP